MLLAAMDYDPLHGTSKQEIKIDYQAKTILALTT
jgi:hypothetical protein